MQLRLFSFLIFALAVEICVVPVSAATIELARYVDGTSAPGITVEGELVPGDADNLLTLYKKYGVMVSPVHLRSKGGNVEEAMKIGTIIRRLRLETEVPVWDTGISPIDAFKVENPDNEVCASACFLVYVGGASKFGNSLAMHRPFLPREEARRLDDLQYEAAQKAIFPKVKAYLMDMEVDQFWIDRMFAMNSQEYYTPKFDEGSSLNHVGNGLDFVIPRFAAGRLEVSERDARHRSFPASLGSDVALEGDAS